MHTHPNTCTLPRPWLLSVALPLLLAACGPAIPPPSVQTIAAPNPFRHGIVAAVRPVAVITDPGTAAGVTGVLSALRAGATPPGANGEEIVILLRDDSVLTVVEVPGGPDFIVGDTVAVADIGGRAALRRGE